MMRKIICLLVALASVLSLTACGDETEQAAVSGSSETVSQDDILRNSFSYEDEYTQQHLDFIDGDAYSFAIGEYSGMATAVSNCYLDANLNYTNGAWATLSNTAKLINGEKVELLNEYELLVTELMFNSGSIDSFASTYEAKYYDAVIELLNNISEALKDAKKDVGAFTADDLKKIEEFAVYLDGAVALLKEDTEGDKNSETPGFTNTVKEVKKNFTEEYLGKNKDLVDKVKKVLGNTAKVASFLSENLTDIFDEYVIFQSLKEASAEWETVWSDVSGKLKALAIFETDNVKAEAYNKVAACIDKVLAQTASYRESNALALLETATEKVTTNLVADAGKALLDKVMESWPIGKAIKDGAHGGVSIANALLNSDDIAYYGQMLIGYGSLAEGIYTTMLDMEDDLRAQQTYSSALLFDQAFHIYKQFQLASMDCTSNYLLAIIDAPIGRVFVNSTKDERLAVSQLALKKSDLEPIHCHGIQIVYNNGGYVVGYRDNLYYFRSTEKTQAQSGTYGYFEPNQDVEKDLICRDKDGKETKLTSAAATGQIFICREKLLYRKYDGWWYSIGLDGKNEKKEIQSYISSYLPNEGMLVVQSGETEFYATDFTGNVSPLPSDPNALGEYLGTQYYCTMEGLDTFVFYCIDAQHNRKELGTVKQQPSSNREHAVYADYCVASDGIYILIGTQGGTGTFFYDGTIYRISFETDTVDAVADGVEYAKMRLVTDESGEYLYYTTESYMGVSGLYDGSVNKGVKCLDLKTGISSDVQLPLQDNGTVYIRDGLLQVLHRSQKEPTVILSKEKAQESGIGLLGEQNDGSCLYHEWAQLVNDTYYVLITKAAPDEESSIGWRQGYRRVSSTLYSISTKDGTVSLIYSY